MDNLPWVVVWIDWNFYAYKLSLLTSLIFWAAHWYQQTNYHSFTGLSLALFIGFCFWNTYCAVRYGYAVG